MVLCLYKAMVNNIFLWWFFDWSKNSIRHDIRQNHQLNRKTGLSTQFTSTTIIDCMCRAILTTLQQKWIKTQKLTVFRLWAIICFTLFIWAYLQHHFICHSIPLYTKPTDRLFFQSFPNLLGPINHSFFLHTPSIFDYK